MPLRFAFVSLCLFVHSLTKDGRETIINIFNKRKDC